jgi:4-hydroxy-3-polyprenylbenzoate decarboxylase
MNSNKTIALAMTGASGAQYGLRLLECLLAAGQHVYLMLSKPAQIVIGMETDLTLPGRPKEIQRFFVERFQCRPEQLQVFDRDQWTAPVASGSGAPDSMVICPCTTGTLAAVANGLCDQLIHRAADVMLKERRRLILVLRETPYSAVHLQNMLAVTQAGGIVMPSNPGFYNKPQSVADLVDFMVARILDHLGVEQTLSPRWGHDSYE